MTKEFSRCILDAFGLPREAIVDQRIPKKLITEHGTSSAVDRRNVSEGIEEVRWLAVIKPINTAVSTFVDAARDYSEISILSALLKPDAHITRLEDIIHRAIPYPIFLILHQSDEAKISLGHKRRSLNENGAFVLDGSISSLTLGSEYSEGAIQSFLGSLSVAKSPQKNLWAIYEMWLDAFNSLRASKITGEYVVSLTTEQAVERATAISEYETLEKEIKKMRAIAVKERQLAKQVELNLAVKELEFRLHSLKKKL
jgi:hypothetical protein